jgi:3-methyladenine DNA glycosylase Tag
VRILREQEYTEIADSINQMVGRQAVTPKKIKSVIKEAKHIRKTQGTPGLLRFATALPYQFFTPQELEYIQTTPQYRELSARMIDLLVAEGVISSFEAMFLRRQV